MQKNDIVNDIEAIQLKVKRMGFTDRNEIDIWTRNLIAEYMARKINTDFVSKRKEILISTLYGWECNKNKGLSIENYVNKIEQ